MNNMNPVVHFEMPAEDRQRMANFYSEVFGWKMKMMGEEMGNYVVVSTTETDEKGMIKNPGAINGGFYPKEPDKTDQYPSIVIAVKDIDMYMKKIQREGGEVMGKPTDIPGVGKYVSFIDTEGNRVSILQPKEME